MSLCPHMRTKNKLAIKRIRNKAGTAKNARVANASTLDTRAKPERKITPRNQNVMYARMIRGTSNFPDKTVQPPNSENEPVNIMNSPKTARRRWRITFSGTTVPRTVLPSKLPQFPLFTLSERRETESAREYLLLKDTSTFGKR